MKTCQELIHELALTWCHRELPEIPRSVVHADEFAGCYDLIQGVSWDKLDVTQRKLNGQLWILELPLESQSYYFGSLLLYSLNFYEAKLNDPFLCDSDTPFRSMVEAAKVLVVNSNVFSRIQSLAVVDILTFIDVNFDYFGAGDHYHKKLKKTISLWRRSLEGQRNR